MFKSFREMAVAGEALNKRGFEKSSGGPTGVRQKVQGYDCEVVRSSPFFGGTMTVTEYFSTDVPQAREWFDFQSRL
jgi:hypothetical protein